MRCPARGDGGARFHAMIDHGARRRAGWSVVMPGHAVAGWGDLRCIAPARGIKRRRCVRCSPLRRTHGMQRAAIASRRSAARRRRSADGSIRIVRCWTMRRRMRRIVQQRRLRRHRSTPWRRPHPGDHRRTLIRRRRFSPGAAFGAASSLGVRVRSERLHPRRNDASMGAHPSPPTSGMTCAIAAYETCSGRPRAARFGDERAMLASLVVGRRAVGARRDDENAALKKTEACALPNGVLKRAADAALGRRAAASVNGFLGRRGAGETR